MIAITTMKLWHYGLNIQSKERGKKVMSIVFTKFGKKQFNKGRIAKRGKYMLWVNLWGFGVIVSNTCKGLKYDMSLSQ